MVKPSRVSGGESPHCVSVYGESKCIKSSFGRTTFSISGISLWSNLTQRNSILMMADITLKRGQICSRDWSDLVLVLRFFWGTFIALFVFCDVLFVFS